MKEILDQINEKYVPFWLSLKDPKGGFFGGLTANGKPDENANKGLNMHFKILWFFSRAFQAFKTPQLKAAADHAYNFIIEKFLDKTYGGFYYTVTPSGSVLDPIKHARNFALGLYAFTAYFDITREYVVLKYAYECFNILEYRCKRMIGYREQFDEFFMPIANTKCGDESTKRHIGTMLHMLEAYIDFYYRTKDVKVKDSLNYLYDLMKYRVVDNKTGVFGVYMDDGLDSMYDVFDAGFNMFGSWTMTNAGLCLGIFGRDDLAIVKKLVDETLKECFDSNSVIHRIYSKNKKDTDKVSWVQAESIIALLNLYSLTKDNSYLDKAKKIWKFVKDNLLDVGGWNPGITKTNEPIKKPNVGEYRGPYNEGRMLLEVLRRGISIS